MKILRATLVATAGLVSLAHAEDAGPLTQTQLRQIVERNSSNSDEAAETVTDLCKRFPSISPDIAREASSQNPKWVMIAASAAVAITPEKCEEITKKCSPLVPNGLEQAFASELAKKLPSPSPSPLP